MSLLHFTIQPRHCALRYLHGSFEQVLPAGRHRRRLGQRLVVVDLRERLTQVAPQEVLTSDGVAVRVTFSRYHVGGNHAVHGGVLPLLFDSVFGMVIHAAGRPISRTAFLHVDYRKVTPIDTELTARGRIREAEGRKAFVNAELHDGDGNLLAEAHGLMIRLLAGQP